MAASFAGKNLEHYLPSQKVVRRRSDRIVELERPLFPGYVFCRFPVQRRLPILTTPGVVSILGFGVEPSPIPDAIETPAFQLGQPIIGAPALPSVTYSVGSQLANLSLSYSAGDKFGRKGNSPANPSSVCPCAKSRDSHSAPSADRATDGLGPRNPVPVQE